MQTQIAAINAIDIPALNYGNKSSAMRAGKRQADTLGINHSKVITKQNDDGKWVYEFDADFVSHKSMFEDGDKLGVESASLVSDKLGRGIRPIHAPGVDLTIPESADLPTAADVDIDMVGEPVNTSLDGILRKSTILNPCKVVWDIAAKMDGSKRSEIVQACVEAGIAKNTAKTQYQQYFAAKRNS